MNMRALVVFGSTLAMSATLAAQTQKPQPAHRTPVVKPAQSQQGARGGAPGDFSRFGLNFFYSAPLEGKVVKGAPYSADMETESVQTLGDGNRIVYRSTGRVYRDAEGRVRREEKNGSNETITITDPVANKSFTLEPATRTASQTLSFGLFSFYLDGLHMSPGRFEYGYRPAPGVVISRGAQNDYTIALGRGARAGRTRDGRDEYVEEQLPNRTIEGVVASGIRKTTTIPQGAIGNEQPIKTVSEEWTSVDLQVLVLTDVNDPRTGRTTYRLTNINRGDPDPALFKVPSDYTIRLALRQKK
jgi:hypothetical protein